MGTLVANSWPLTAGPEEESGKGASPGCEWL